MSKTERDCSLETQLTPLCHRHRHSHLLVMNEVFVIDRTVSSGFPSRPVNTDQKVVNYHMEIDHKLGYKSILIIFFLN